MVISDFLIKYTDANVKYNKSGKKNSYQCVDLAKAYCAEVLDIYTAIPKLKDNWAWGDAKDWFNKPNAASKSFFNFVKNTSTYVPDMGDIVVWNTGSCGHIAIVIFADRKKMITFDQNWGSANAPCKFVLHNYNNCAGFLRKKV